MYINTKEKGFEKNTITAERSANLLRKIGLIINARTIWNPFSDINQPDYSCH